MRNYLPAAALLVALLGVACGDRRDNEAQRGDEPRPPAGEQAATPPDAAPAAPTEGREAAPAESAEQAAPSARATGGSRSTTPRSAAPAQPSAPRDEPTPRPAEAARSAAPASRAPEFHELTIPEGTALPLELETALSSETAQVETPVRARLRQAVVVNGVTALPAGATVLGNVTSVERAGRVKGRSSLVFTFTQVRANNVNVPLRTAPLSYVGEATKGEDATKIGAGAVGGAIVGGVVGGGEGAAKGAVIGGAAGTGVVLATRGREVELASGTNLAATLAAPLTVRVPAR